MSSLANHFRRFSLFLILFLLPNLACALFQEPITNEMLQEIYGDRDAPQDVALAFTWAMLLQDEVAYELVTEDAQEEVKRWFDTEEAARCEYLNPDDGAQGFLGGDKMTWFIFCSSDEATYHIRIGDFEFERINDGSYLISGWAIGPPGAGELATPRRDCRGLRGLTAQEPLPGPTWLDITVGVSSAQDVVDRFGRPTFVRTWSPRADVPAACWFVYEGVDFWIASETVVGIELAVSGRYVRVEDLPRSVDELIRQYGAPERVAWSSAPDSEGRIVVWPDQGVAADVVVGRRTSPTPLWRR